MHVEVALVFVERQALQVVVLAGLDPALAGFLDRDAFRIGGVSAAADVRRDRRVFLVGLLLLRERLDVPDAILVDVVDDPGLLFDALCVGPVRLRTDVLAPLLLQAALNHQSDRSGTRTAIAPSPFLDLRQRFRRHTHGNCRIVSCCGPAQLLFVYRKF